MSSRGNSPSQPTSAAQGDGSRMRAHERDDSMRGGGLSRSRTVGYIPADNITTRLTATSPPNYLCGSQSLRNPQSMHDAAGFNNSVHIEEGGGIVNTSPASANQTGAPEPLLQFTWNQPPGIPDNVNQTSQGRSQGDQAGWTRGGIDIDSACAHVAGELGAGGSAAGSSDMLLDFGRALSSGRGGTASGSGMPLDFGRGLSSGRGGNYASTSGRFHADYAQADRDHDRRDPSSKHRGFDQASSPNRSAIDQARTNPEMRQSDNSNSYPVPHTRQRSNSFPPALLRPSNAIPRSNSRLALGAQYDQRGQFVDEENGDAREYGSGGLRGEASQITRVGSAYGASLNDNMIPPAHNLFSPPDPLPLQGECHRRPASAQAPPLRQEEIPFNSIMSHALARDFNFPKQAFLPRGHEGQMEERLAERARGFPGLTGGPMGGRPGGVQMNRGTSGFTGTSAGSSGADDLGARAGRPGNPNTSFPIHKACGVSDNSARFRGPALFPSDTGHSTPAPQSEPIHLPSFILEIIGSNGELRARNVTDMPDIRVGDVLFGDGVRLPYIVKRVISNLGFVKVLIVSRAHEPTPGMFVHANEEEFLLKIQNARMTSIEWNKCLEFLRYKETEEGTTRVLLQAPAPFQWHRPESVNSQHDGRLREPNGFFASTNSKDWHGFMMEKADTLAEYILGKGSAARPVDRVRVIDREIVNCVSGMFDAVGVVHARDQLHQDVKPGNFLVRDPKVILGDMMTVSAANKYCKIGGTYATHSLTACGVICWQALNDQIQQANETVRVLITQCNTISNADKEDAIHRMHIANATAFAPVLGILSKYAQTGYTWLDECRSVVKSLERLRGEIAQGAGLDLDPTAGELFGKNPHHFMTDMADEFFGKRWDAKSYSLDTIEQFSHKWSKAFQALEGAFTSYETQQSIAARTETIPLPVSGSLVRRLSRYLDGLDRSRSLGQPIPIRQSVMEVVKAIQHEVLYDSLPLFGNPDVICALPVQLTNTADDTQVVWNFGWRRRDGSGFGIYAHELVKRDQAAKGTGAGRRTHSCGGCGLEFSTSKQVIRSHYQQSASCHQRAVEEFRKWWTQIALPDRGQLPFFYIKPDGAIELWPA